MSDSIYFIGWNKRIELKREGDNLLYIERDPNGPVIRLKCDVMEKKMILEKKEKNEDKFVEINELKIVRGIVLDLSESGERWEGDLLNGLPFGYGTLYNSENELMYSGFMYEGERMCFGEEFRQSKVEYCGSFYKNHRHGVGKLYNLESELVYEGNWYFGKNVVEDVEITPELGDSVVHNEIKKLIVGDGYHCDLNELKLTDFPVLESICVGKKCFKGVKFFEISNCVNLERIDIGDYSFYDEQWGEPTGCFLVHNCVNLREISIDCCSFLIYSNLILESKFD